MADFFNVDVRTIYRWKVVHDDFCQAMKAGKEFCDERVERSLYQRAVGYEQDAVKVFMPQNALEPVYAPYRERVAPDVGAAKHWLGNRRRKDWRDTTHLASDPDNPLTNERPLSSFSEGELVAAFEEAQRRRKGESDGG